MWLGVLEFLNVYGNWPGLRKGELTACWRSFVRTARQVTTYLERGNITDCEHLACTGFVHPRAGP